VVTLCTIPDTLNRFRAGAGVALGSLSTIEPDIVLRLDLTKQMSTGRKGGMVHEAMVEG